LQFTYSWYFLISRSALTPAVEDRAETDCLDMSPDINLRLASHTADHPAGRQLKSDNWSRKLTARLLGRAMFSVLVALVLGHPGCNNVGWLQCKLMVTKVLGLL